MWLSFGACLLVTLIILYIPGAIICRSFRIRVSYAIAAAPLVSVGIISLTCVIYGKIGLSCNSTSVVAPLATVACAATLISLFVSRHNQGNVQLLPSYQAKETWRTDLISLLPYIAFGLFVCSCVYIKALDGPESFYARYDNILHLNTIRSFLDSGIWSSLQVSSYLGAPDNAMPRCSTGFYPAAWHDLAALVCSITGCNVPMGSNAVNAVASGVVFPASMWAFTRSIFTGNKRTLFLGAITTMAFTAFPWGFFLKGPLYPNLLAYALMPAVFGLLVEAARAWRQLRNWLSGILFVGLLSAIALCLSQPNALFSVYVFLVVLVVKTVYDTSKEQLGIQKALIASAACALTGILVWAAILQFPFFAKVLSYTSKDKAGSIATSIYNAFSLAFSSSLPQILLSVTLLAGLVGCLVNRQIWILVPAFYFFAAYIISNAPIDALRPLNSFMGGLWYTDPTRLAACAVIFSAPIAAVGLGQLVDILTRLFCCTSKRSSPVAGTSPVAAVVIILFCIVNFYPNYYLPKSAAAPSLTSSSAESSGGAVVTTDEGTLNRTSFGYISRRLSNVYRMDEKRVYTASEQAFVDKVEQTIPKDSLVINQPHDGSVFAYAVNNLNTYFRQTTAKDESDNARLIRESLDQIAVNDKVQKAVAETGAHYVLLLDQGVGIDEGRWFRQYAHPENWKGINSINDETPGFKVVLSEGDMKLYEITQ